MNNDNKPPASLNFHNIRTGNYTLSWSGLIFMHGFLLAVHYCNSHMVKLVKTYAQGFTIE